MVAFVAGYIQFRPVHPVKLFSSTKKEATAFFSRQWKKRPSSAEIQQIVRAAFDGWTFIDCATAIGKSIRDSVVKTSASIRQGSLWACAGKVGSIFRWFELAFIAVIPLNLLSIGVQSVSLFKNQTDRFDNFLNIISEVGAILRTASSLSLTLHALGLIKTTIVTIAAPLALIGIGLETASIVLTVRNLWQTTQFSKEFSAHAEVKGAISDDDFKRMVEFLITQETSSKRKKSRHRYKIEKHFGSNGKKLDAKLTKIYDNAHRLSNEEKRAIIHTLKRRMRLTQISNVIGIVSGIVSFAGCLITAVSALTLPELVPLGCAALALGSVGFIGKFAFDMICTYRFNKTINQTIKSIQNEIDQEDIQNPDDYKLSSDTFSACSSPSLSAAS